MQDVRLFVIFLGLLCLLLNRPTSNRYESEWILRGLLGACGGQELSSDEVNAVSTEPRSVSSSVPLLSQRAASASRMHLTCVEALLRSMRNNVTLTVRRFTSPGKHDHDEYVY
jgi:hypothetical protein